jgi:hypothetical protein
VNPSPSSGKRWTLSTNRPRRPYWTGSWPTGTSRRAGSGESTRSRTRSMLDGVISPTWRYSGPARYHEISLGGRDD